MLKSLSCGLATAAILVIFSFATPASAAPVKSVLAACDNTPGCGYSINKKNGDISGCSKTSCFYCANDGKRQCISLAKSKAPIVHLRQPVLHTPTVVQLY